MRASRLVNVLLLLQTRSRMTAGELADELEVSVRTIYRDVEALAEAGVPIYAERGPHGGVRLVDGYRTRLTGLTAEEAEAVFLSGMPGPRPSSDSGRSSRRPGSRSWPRSHPSFGRGQGAWPNGSCSMPRAGSRRPTRCRTSSSSRMPSGRSGGLRMTYQRSDRVDPVERTIEPLGLVLKGGTWYLVAETGDSIRTYRVSRIREVTLSGERFVRPDGFDLAAHWEQSRLAYEQSIEPVEVVVRLVAADLDRLASVAGARPMATARRWDDPIVPDHIQVRLAFDWDDDAVEAAVRLYDTVEVLEPDWVRQAVIDTARAILTRYGVGSGRVRPA